MTESEFNNNCWLPHCRIESRHIGVSRHRTEDVVANEEKEAIQVDDCEKKMSIRRMGWETVVGFREGLENMSIPPRGCHKAGMVLGSSETGNALVDTSDSHVLMVGATGSGKSRRAFMESILTLIGTDDIAFVYDPKGETYRYTSGPLEEGGFRTFCIDLRDPRNSAGFNPFSWIYTLHSEGTVDAQDRAAEMVTSMAASVCPVLNHNDIYWESMGQFAIAGLGLEVLKHASCAEDVSFHSIYTLANKVFKDKESMAAFSRQIPSDSTQGMMLEPVLVNADNTRNCILSTMRQHLLPFVQSEAVVSMLRRDDLQFDEILRGKSVLYVISPEEKQSLNPLASILVKLLYEYILDQAYRNGTGTVKNRVHFFLDEAGNLSFIDSFSGMLTAGRSRNIRFYLALQSLNQLDRIYGSDAATIRGNCLLWMFISSRDLSTLDEVSALAGTDSNGCCLITPTELQRLDRASGEVLVLRDRKGPFISHLSDISNFGIKPKIERITSASNKGRMDVASMKEDLVKAFAGKGWKVSIGVSEIQAAQRLCDMVGFRGKADKLAELIEIVATTIRYQEAYDAIRAKGMLSNKVFGDDVKETFRVVRSKYAFLRQIN